MTGNDPRPRTAGDVSSRRGRRRAARRRRRIAVVSAVVAVILMSVAVIGGAWLVGVPSRDEGDVGRSVRVPETARTDARERDVPEHDALSKGAVPAADAALAGQRRLDALRGELERRISGYQGTWQMYLEDLSSGASIAVNDHRGYSASVIKLYVMLAVYQRISDGALAETDAIDELLRQMITVSSNEATNALIDTLGGGDADDGFSVVNDTAQRYGFTETYIHQYLGDLDGDPNQKQTSAVDSGRFMAAAYRGELVSPEYSRRMLDLLLGQTRRAKIPGGVPDGVMVANKTGEIPGVENDAAIVFATADTSAAIDGSATEGDYVLTVMTSDVADSAAAQASIRDLSAAVWAAMEG